MKEAKEEAARFFPECRIVGWGIIEDGSPMSRNREIKRIQEKEFAEEWNLFLWKNAREQEEVFYAYKFGEIMQMGGHYIYYEKNPEMLHYMERENNRHVHIVEQEDDRVVRNIRGIMEEKEKFRTKKKQKEVHMGYGIAAVTALIVVFAFVVLMQNQSALNQVKQQLNTIQTMNRSRPANQDKTIVETQKAKLTPCPSTVPPTQENTSVPSVSPTPVPSAPAQNGVAQ